MTNASDRGNGSLRAAIAAADSSKGHDRIVLARGLGREIRIHSKLIVDEEATIVGDGKNGTRLVAIPNRRHRYPRLVYKDPQGKHDRLVVSRLTTERLGVIADGRLAIRESSLSGNLRAGAAVSPYGDTTISDTRIEGWSNGVFAYKSGELEIQRSTIVGNGTGLEIVYASAEVAGTTIAKNETGVELDTYGHVELRSSKVSGNSPGGGIEVQNGSGVALKRSAIFGNRAPQGGGVHLGIGEVLKAENSTISGNVATGGNGQPGRGGGIYGEARPHVYLEDTTVSANRADEGGGLFLTEVPRRRRPKITASIVAGNDSASGPECVFTGDELPDLFAGNVFGPDGCGAERPEDIRTAAPGLLPLRDNGGPTPTHALEPSSPAIDHGLHAETRLDQRGVRRDGESDSGAFEFR